LAQKVIVPRLGQTMKEGIVAKWLKRDGDAVQAGEDIYELEYDKAVATIQAKKSGIIRLLCEEGAAIPVSGVVGIILEENEKLEDIDLKGAYSASNLTTKGVSMSEEGTASGEPVASMPTDNSKIVKATPMIKRLAKEMGIDITKVVPSDPSKGIRKEDLEAYAGKRKQVMQSDEIAVEAIGQEIKVSPMARKLASQLNIDLSKIVPSDGKRISKEDVLAYSENMQVKAGDIKADSGNGKRVKLSGMRKVIAQRMAKSYFTYPTVTLTTDADISELLKLREQMNGEFARKNIKLTVTDMLVKAVAKALKENEIINVSLIEDEIIYHDQINVGIAVALDDGLIVPVIRNADKLKLEEIASESKRLIALARNKQIGGDDITGGTFTITNLGTYGIDSFNPIINYPESAILGVGRTVEKPAVSNGEIVITKKTVLSLTHDHRVIDGVPAAEFLKSVVHYIEKPFLLLVD
jgi:pyruvate dehydrogenase E2 component (dihydrolipoamide acetyltransferase)